MYPVTDLDKNERESNDLFLAISLDFCLLLFLFFFSLSLSLAHRDRDDGSKVVTVLRLSSCGGPAPRRHTRPLSLPRHTCAS